MTTWRDAVSGIPRVEEADWGRLMVSTRWLIAARAAVLVMTLLSAVIAGILAWRDGVFDWPAWIALTVGLLAAHAANNLVNDLTDHLTGADRNNSFRTRYGTQPLETGLMTVRQNLTYAVLTALVAAAAGVYLLVERGTGIFWLTLAGAVFLVGYTWPLKHIGLGELSALVVWGPLMIGGGYYAMGGDWSWEVVVAGMPYALGVTTVLIAKHIDKYDNDRTRGIATLPLLIGAGQARFLVLAMVIAQYLIVVGLVVTGRFEWPVLSVLAAAPLLRYLFKVFKNPAPNQPPEEYPESAWPLWYVSFAFVHNRRFGALFVAGLLVEALLMRL